MIRNKFLASFIIALLFSLFTTFSFAGSTQQSNQPVNDTVITSKIKTLYTRDPILNPFTVNVTANNGVVTLSGMLDSDTQFERAVTIAEATNGVTKINAANLKVKNSTAPLSDTLITAQIKGLLLKNKIAKGSKANFLPVHVETKDGIVYLSGNVTNKAQISNIEQLAKSVDGVKSVKSTLTVKNS